MPNPEIPLKVMGSQSTDYLEHENLLTLPFGMYAT